MSVFVASTSKSASQPTARHLTIKAITAFYILLTRLPYISPLALRLPPPGGWPSIDEAELKRRGKTDSVISILRDLPYFNQDDKSSWSLAQNTQHINYARGEMYDSHFEDHLLTVPGHVIWLSAGSNEVGPFWLLDTQTWEIIEYTLSHDTLETPWNVFEMVPLAEKWRHFSRMPADKYFHLWRWKYESLEFMIMRENRWMDHFHVKDPVLLWEERQGDRHDDDGDFVPVSVNETMDEISAMSDDSSDEGLECEEMEWDMVEDVNELHNSTIDATQTLGPRTDITQKSKIAVPTYLSYSETSSYTKGALCVNGQLRKPYVPDTKVWNTPRHIRLREEVKELLAIYHRNGWPKHERFEVAGHTRNEPPSEHVLAFSHFDRERCSQELLEWMQNRRRKSREKQAHRTHQVLHGSRRDVSRYNRDCKRMINMIYTEKLGKSSSTGERER